MKIRKFRTDSVKQVIVMRKDLGMRKGKMIAQGAHASLGVVLKHLLTFILCKIFKKKYSNTPYGIWINGQFTKIVLGVNSEKDLMNIHHQVIYKDKVEERHIPYALIKDAGKTEFHGNSTYTCIAIGPWWSKEIDEITGDLKLL